MQLVAYGAQDIYLTGNPQITFFKVVYRRHTNFSVESIEQTFNGSAEFNKKMSCTISRNGDLLNRVYLETDVSSSSPISSIGNVAETSAGLESLIQSLYGTGTATDAGTGAAWAQAGNAVPIGALSVSVDENGVAKIGIDSTHFSDTNLETDDNIVFTAVDGVLPSITATYGTPNADQWNVTVADNLGDGNADVLATDATAVLSGSSGSGATASSSVSVATNGTLSVSSTLVNKGSNYKNETLTVSMTVSGAAYTVGNVNAVVVDTSTDNYGFKILEYVELEIGGQCIDKHYGEWMTLWTDLTHGGTGSTLLDRMISLENLQGGKSQKLYIPLQFWFCRNPGLALPLIALQYHEVKINVQFASAPVQHVSLDNMCVFCDYIFLDTDERRRFAQVSHEYLIDQVQYSNAVNGGSGTTAQLELRFNHPVKELVWTVEDDAATPEFRVVKDALLQLNGHDRFKRRMGDYFSTVQRYQHHNGSTGSRRAHIYSFALKPEEHQPSGSCNFSRIDNAVLNLSAKQAGHLKTIKVFAVNYNVLRIMSGMGGLAYSN